MPFLGNILKNSAGFSYVEVLAATIIIGTCLVPLLNGLSTIAIGPAILEESVINRLTIQSKMDELRAEPYQNLLTAANTAGSVTTQTSYSDQITSSDNRPIKRYVFLAKYDVDDLDGDSDPLTANDPNIIYPIYIKVVTDQSNSPLETLINL